MTSDKKLKTVKAMLDIASTNTEQDALLMVYLGMAETAILQKAYPYDDTVCCVPDKYSYIQCEIAVYLYNKRGAEGEKIHNENGINRTYESASIPDSMLKQVITCAGVIE